MTEPWYCPACSIQRRSLPCADCGACSGCCEVYQRPQSEAWLRAQGWSPEMYGPPTDLNIAEGDAAPSLPTRRTSRRPRETGPTSGETIEEPTQ